MKNGLIKIFLVLNIVIFSFLAIVSFIFSWKNVELVDEHVFRFQDFIFGNIVGLLLVLVIAYIVTSNRRLLEKINTKYVALGLGILTVVFSLYWVLNSGTAPQSDARAVCEAASTINAGDYTDFQKGEYVAIYPQQLGLITLMRVLFYLFGDDNYVSFQILSALSTFVIVYSTYGIASLLSEGNKVVELISTVLVFLCLPMYMYTAFVYGEILSIAMIMLSILFFLKAYRDCRVINLFMTASAVFAAIMARQNSVIVVIAMFCVLSFSFIFTDKRKIALVIAVAIMIGVLFQSFLIKALYDKHWDADVTHLPSLMWIAMGTNDDYNRAGWYNGQGTILFWDNDLDEEKSKEAAKEVIKNFVGVCLSDPVYGADFYARKISSQWSAPMYQGLVMNNNIEGEQSALVSKIFHDEKVWKVLDAFMNIYQLVIYFSVLALLIWLIKRDWTIEYYIGLIAVLGGFLFSILWETKSRYVFPYLIIMIPYGAVGLELVTKWIRKWRNRND